MNIIYSSSDFFSQISGISVVSLFENNKDAEEINVYVIDNNISQINKEKHYQIAEKYGRNIVFLPKIDIEKECGFEFEIGRWNISTFFRLFLCTILPDTIDRCIYLDGDTIVRHSLKALWETDLKGKLVGAVDDCRSDHYKFDLGLNKDNTYTNNGVLLIDLKGWRKIGVEKDFYQFIKQRDGNITYVDQGVLNGVLSAKGLVEVIHTKYNVMTVFFDFNYKDLLKIRKPQRCLSQQEYTEATNDPYIVHFTSCFMSGTRPWNEKNTHPYVSEYLHYKEISPWKDNPLIPDDRGFAKKMMTKLCNIMPKGLMIAIISLVHSKLYPMVRKMKHSGKK